MKNLPAFFLLSLLVLTSCGPATPTEPPVGITLQYTAITQPWLAAIYACAGANLIEARLEASDRMDVAGADLTLRVGEFSQPSSFTYEIGVDPLEVIANDKNPLKKLSPDQVEAIFTGRVANWKGLGGPDAPIQVWVFGAGEDVEQLFEQTALGGTPVTSLGGLAVGPDEMADSVAADPNAVGILTGDWKAANVSNLLTVATEPVLIFTPAEPQGTVLEIINCLQK